jgi:hypothetical protein
VSWRSEAGIRSVDGAILVRALAKPAPVEKQTAEATQLIAETGHGHPEPVELEARPAAA